MILTRALWNAAGFLFVGIGLIGALVPGLPSTLWFILALGCFKRGSERFQEWLLGLPVVGSTLADWEHSRCIRPRTKRIAIVTLWAFIVVSLVLCPSWMGRAGIVAVALGVTWYISTRASEPRAEKFPLSPLGERGQG